MEKMVSLMVPDSMLREIQRVAATVGLSRSELLREGINLVIEHYNKVEQGPDCKEMLKKIHNLLTKKSEGATIS